MRDGINMDLEQVVVYRAPVFFDSSSRRITAKIAAIL
jgi:hypothetical protein